MKGVIVEEGVKVEDEGEVIVEREEMIVGIDIEIITQAEVDMELVTMIDTDSLTVVDLQAEVGAGIEIDQEMNIHQAEVIIEVFVVIEMVNREGYQIIIKNIPWSVTWQQLKDAFREYGPISRADVPQDETVYLFME